MLHTNSDYWFLAGYRSLVEEMTGTSIAAGFYKFAKAVTVSPHHEPGGELAAACTSFTIVGY